MTACFCLAFLLEEPLWSWDSISSPLLRGLLFITEEDCNFNHLEGRIR